MCMRMRYERVWLAEIERETWRERNVKERED